MAFTISSDDAGAGVVTHIGVLDGGLGQPFMEGCVLNAFQEIRFTEASRRRDARGHLPRRILEPGGDPSRAG